MDDIQFMVTDADADDLFFLQANGRPEVLAGIAEASHELL